MSLRDNHFQLFGFEPHFAIDTDRLAQVYRDLQRSVHPDRYATAPDQQRRIAIQKAAQINEGYQTLKDPLHRARYLLELAGVMAEDHRDTAMDPQFLMEQMELRERLADVGEDEQALDTLAQIQQEIRHRVAMLTEQLQQAFAESSMDALAAARETVRKMQFFYKLREEVDERSAHLEDQFF